MSHVISYLVKEDDGRRTDACTREEAFDKLLAVATPLGDQGRRRAVEERADTTSIDYMVSNQKWFVRQRDTLDDKAIPSIVHTELWRRLHSVCRGDCSR